MFACGARAAAPEPAKPREETPQITTVCPMYGYRALLPQGAASADPAYDRAHYDAAHDDFDAQIAISNNQHRKAARHYLECAARFRAVATESEMRFAATANARICYTNAMIAFANAGDLSTVGRAELERAAVDDPPLADAIGRMLAAAPSECVP